MSRVVVSGYYGYGNVGDEFVLDSLVQWLRDTGVCEEVVVLSSSPIRTSARLGVRSVHRYNPVGVASALLGSPLLVSGGGTLIQDRTSVRSALYYLTILALALALGRRVAVVGQGLGPIDTGLVRRLARAVLSRVDCIALRDCGSVDLLERIGVSRARVKIGADLAFLSTARRDRQVESEAAERGPVALVMPSHRSRPRDPEWASILARRMQEAVRGRRDVEVLAFQAADAMLSAKHGTCRPQVVRVDEADQLMQRFSVVASARLHGLILAVRAGVPGIALGSDPKIRCFAEEAGLPWIDPDEKAPYEVATWVCSHVQRILSDYSSAAAAVGVASEELSARAREGMEGLLDLLGRVCASSAYGGRSP